MPPLMQLHQSLYYINIIFGWIKISGAQVHTLNNISMKFQVCSTNVIRVMDDTTIPLALCQKCIVFTNARPITLKY